MLKFIPLSSGSNGNCYVLYTETDALMIDAGIGIRTLKKFCIQYNLSMKHVKHVLVTHDHADHVKSVGKVSNAYSLPVYTTMEVYEGIGRNYCVTPKIQSENVHCLEKNHSYQLGSFEVTPVAVPHDSTDCVGYKIKCQGIVFGLMTDVGHVTPELEQLIGEANYLVLEANHDVEMVNNGPYPQHLKNRILSPTGHLSNTDSATALVKNATEQLQHVWLCHLSEENNHPILVEKTFQTIFEQHGLRIGEDIKIEVLKRKVPTGIYVLSLPQKQEK